MVVRGTCGPCRGSGTGEEGVWDFGVTDRDGPVLSLAARGAHGGGPGGIATDGPGGQRDGGGSGGAEGVVVQADWKAASGWRAGGSADLGVERIGSDHPGGREAADSTRAIGTGTRAVPFQRGGGGAGGASVRGADNKGGHRKGNSARE